MLPGFGLPLNFSPMTKDLYGINHRSLFPSALDDRDIDRGYIKYGAIFFSLSAFLFLFLFFCLCFRFFDGLSVALGCLIVSEASSNMVIFIVSLLPRSVR